MQNLYKHLFLPLTVFHSEVENNAKDLDGRHAIMQFDSMKIIHLHFLCAIFKLVIVTDVLNSPAFCRGFQKSQAIHKIMVIMVKITLH